MFEGLSLKHWRWESSANGVIHLILDVASASTNTLSREVMAELGKLLERIRIEPPVGVVFLSAKDSGFNPNSLQQDFEKIVTHEDRARRLAARLAPACPGSPARRSRKRPRTTLK